jgi:hypothetical protein
VLCRYCGAGVRDVPASRPVRAGLLSQLLGGLLLRVEMSGLGDDLVAGDEGLVVVGEFGAAAPADGCHRRGAVPLRGGPATAAPTDPGWAPTFPPVYTKFPSSRVPDRSRRLGPARPGPDVSPLILGGIEARNHHRVAERGGVDRESPGGDAVGSDLRKLDRNRAASLAPSHGHS